MGADDVEMLGMSRKKGPIVTQRSISRISGESAYDTVDSPIDIVETKYERSKRRRKSYAASPPPVNVFKHPVQWVKREYMSWRFYTVLYASLAVAVWLWNFLALVGVIAVHGVDSNGRVTIHTGDCARIKRENMYIHWFISVFGTGFLSASAYVMYCLMTPTREEVDVAHSKGQWLDIGVMSMKNISAMSKKRLFLWLLLGVSSPFLQFFYNSVLFMTWSTNAYSAFVAHESFARPGNITVQLSDNPAEALQLGRSFGELAQHLHTQALAGKLEQLSPKDCIDAYAVPLQAARRNVVLITSDDHTKMHTDSDAHTRPADVFDVFHAWIPLEHPEAFGEQYSWVCDDKLGYSDQCLYHVRELRANPNNWTISDDAKVKYCLSEKTDEHCKLQVGVTLSVIVLVTLFFKTVIMFAVAFTVNEKPLMTTGDAISSFMSDPDPYTEGMCMASKRMIEEHNRRWPSTPIFVRLDIFRWWHTIKTRLVLCCLMFLLSICANGALFCTVNEPISFANFLRTGMGQVNRNFFIGWHHKTQKYMIRSIWIANLGHAIFGMLYIIFNNVIYCMVFSWEWARYASHRKGLRVSEAPRGSQRTVYFFLMPYRLAFPIMAFSIGIHTLVSQTLFLVDVETYGHDPLKGERMGAYMRTPQYDFTTTGFSPLGNVALIAVGLGMIGFLVWCGQQRLDSPMPVTSTCSAAISAACHSHVDEPDDAVLQPLQWGVTDITDGIGHCTFSSRSIKGMDDCTPYR